MMRNDYRRALILLRSGEPGYTGHVRLERRTLMGSMYFMVQPPRDGEVLHAALVGRGKDDYYACDLGQLREDGRGQASLSFSFDPRSICSRELEDYQLVAVAAVSGGDCRIVLCGNVDGHAEMNWERVRQALCLTLTPAEESPCAPHPREEAAQPWAEDAGSVCAPELELPGLDAAQAAETLAEAEPQVMEAPGIERLEALPAAEEEAIAAPPAAPEPEGQTAAELLGADMSLPWPEEIGELKALFEQSAPLLDAPDNGYVYVATPLPEGSPYDFLAAGLRAENGLPFAVSYALPAPYTAEPPAGLEAYRWLGDSNRGWWVSEIDLNTGMQF